MRGPENSEDEGERDRTAVKEDVNQEEQGQLSEDCRENSSYSTRWHYQRVQTVVIPRFITQSSAVWVFFFFKNLLPTSPLWSAVSVCSLSAVVKLPIIYVPYAWEDTWICNTKLSGGSTSVTLIASKSPAYFWILTFHPPSPTGFSMCICCNLQTTRNRDGCLTRGFKCLPYCTINGEEGQHGSMQNMAKSRLEPC